MKHFIQQTIIDNLPSIHIDGISKNEDIFVNNLIKHALQYAKDYNNSNEVGILVDKNDWHNCDKVLGTVNHVVFNTDKMNKWLDTGNDNLILIHNHPGNTCFSERDLLRFCRTEAINTIIAVGNKGTIYLAQKLSKFDKQQVLSTYFNLKKTYEDEYDESQIVEMSLKKYRSTLILRFVRRL